MAKRYFSLLVFAKHIFSLANNKNHNLQPMENIEFYIPVLIEYLNSIKQMPPELQSALTSSFKIEKITKGELLLKEPDTCKQLWFLADGLLRSYHFIGDKEITSRLMFTNHIVISAGSFFTQTPATETIEALSDCIVLSLSFESLQKVYQQFPEFNYHGRMITEYYFYKQEQRLYLLRQKNAIDKYKYFLSNYEEYLTLIPQKYLASFLSINPETLSRVRNKMRGK